MKVKQALLLPLVYLNVFEDSACSIFLHLRILLPEKAFATGLFQSASGDDSIQTALVGLLRHTWAASCLVKPIILVFRQEHM